MEDMKNIITIQPRVGDIVCKDGDGEIRYLEQDTFSQADFPETWETVGVVVIRKGNLVTVVSKNNDSRKWMDVYPYVVTDYVLDGTEHTAQLRLHGKPTTSTYYDFTYTASTVDEFVTALQQFLVTNGETDWSAYKDDDGRIILQYDNYTSGEYYTTTITYASGLTLTGQAELDCPQQPNFWRKCGNRGNGVWHAARAKDYFRSDLSSTAYNPATDVNSVPSSPVCWPAFVGTSQYQSDHCLWLRQQYCKDPAHPTEAEWEAYIDDITHRIPYMLGGNAPKWRDGALLSEALKGITYRSTDGTQKPLYPAVEYCSQFFGGRGYLPSMAELIECFGDVTYGLTGVTRDKADPVNRSLYAIGGSAIGCNISWWSSGRNSINGSWYANSNGNIDSGGFYGSRRCAPLVLLTLPEGSIDE